MGKGNYSAQLARERAGLEKEMRERRREKGRGERRREEERGERGERESDARQTYGVSPLQRFTGTGGGGHSEMLWGNLIIGPFLKKQL